MLIRQTTIAGLAGIALTVASTGAFAAENTAPQASTKLQGLYSADQLLDADVYSKSDPKQQVGEIDDILFDNGLHIKSFVVETEGDFGLGGKSYVVSPDHISVETSSGSEATKPHYRVTIDASKQQLSQYPVYSDSWWHKTQDRAAAAWQQTKETASSAWTQIKNTGSDLVNGTKDTADSAADDASDAAHTTADKSKEIYHDATH